MKTLLTIVLTLLAVATASGVVFYRSLAGPDPLTPPPRGVVALDDVVLVEPGVGRLLHKRLELEGSRIAAVTGAEGDGGRWAGAFVLPGLVDAHAHLPPPLLPGQIELFSFLFLKHGVTGIRSMGDVGEGASLRVREALQDGAFAAPRIAACGRWVDGDPPLWANSEVVQSPDDAAAAVAELAARGYDCVKVYNQLDADTLAAVREAARAHDLPVVGHIPFRVRHEDAHLDDPQHLIGFFRNDGPPRFPFDLRNWLQVSDARIDSIIASVLRDGAAMTPTLVVVDRMSRAPDLLADPADPIQRLLPPWYGRGIWDMDLGMNPAREMGADDYAMVRAAIARMQRAVRRIHAAGVPLRAGTDTLAPLTVPGASLQRELALYVEAGLSPEEALAIGIRGSDAFRLAGLGTLRPGAPADFVVYRDDPTRDLAALESILAVVSDGRVYTREMLDAQQARYRESFAGTFQQRIATPLVRAFLRVALRRAAGIETAPE